MNPSRMGINPDTVSEPPLRPIVRFALDVIAAMPPRERPWGVWLARHAPVPAGWVHHLTTPVTDVWFFDGRAVRRRDPWIYARFVTVHQAQPWCGRRDGEPYNVRGIGSVRFAMRDGQRNRAYLEDLWRISGHCGIRAFELAWDASGAITERRPFWEGGAIIIPRLLRA